MERPLSRSAEPSPPVSPGLAAEIDRYRAALQAYLNSRNETPSPLSEAIAEILRTGGKRLRPIISLLTCEAASGSFEKALPVAAIFELAHSASLVQDDIIDESAMRHGQVATHKRYGETRAILISDMMIFEIFVELAKYGDEDFPDKRVAKLSSLIGNAAKLTAEGEFYETVLAEKGSVTEEDYVKLAGLKTGALFAASAAC